MKAPSNHGVDDCQSHKASTKEGPHGAHGYGFAATSGRWKASRAGTRSPARGLDARRALVARCAVGSRAREQVVRSRSRTKKEVHAVLMRRLQSKPPCSHPFRVKGRRWLRCRELPVEEAETVHSALRHIAFLDREIAGVERLIAKQMPQSPDARRVMTVPGVYLIAIAAFLAAIGDIGRFSNSRRLVAYLGSDPKVRQTGEQPARAGRTPRAARHLRGGRWSRPPGASSTSPARCAPTTSGSGPAAAWHPSHWCPRVDDDTCLAWRTCRRY
jgi:hypothetical protein